MLLRTSHFSPVFNSSAGISKFVFVLCRHARGVSSPSAMGGGKCGLINVSLHVCFIETAKTLVEF